MKEQERTVLAVTLEGEDKAPQETIATVTELFMGERSIPSPLSIKTSRFKPTRILFEDDGFVVAEGLWREDPKSADWFPRIACRWHLKNGVGYPNARGYPQWMALPETLRVESTRTLGAVLKSLTLTFSKRILKPKAGDWVRDQYGWHYAVLRYGNDKMISVLGMGDREAYPLIDEEILEIATAANVGVPSLHAWHGKAPKVWLKIENLDADEKRVVEAFISYERNSLLYLARVNVVVSEKSPAFGRCWTIHDATHSPLVYGYQLTDLVLCETLPVDVPLSKGSEIKRELHLVDLDRGQFVQRSFQEDCIERGIVIPKMDTVLESATYYEFVEAN